MRIQACREVIEKTAEVCDLGPDIVTEVKKVAKFCSSNPTFAVCGTRPIYRLISHKDEDIRNRAISIAENRLKQETPTGGKIEKRLTEPEVRKILKKAEIEVRGELTEKYKKEAEAKPPSPFQPATNSIAVTDSPPQPSLAEQLNGTPEPGIIPYKPPALPPLSPDAPMSEVLKRDAILLEMAQAGGGFQTAAEMINGGMVVKPAPYKITPVKLSPVEAGERITAVVRGYLTDKDREIWEDLRKSGQLGDTDLEIFQGLINDAALRMGGA